MPSEASKRMAQEWIDGWLEGEQQLDSLAALLDQRAEAAEAERQELRARVEAHEKADALFTEIMDESGDPAAAELKVLRDKLAAVVGALEQVRGMCAAGMAHQMGPLEAKTRVEGIFKVAGDALHARAEAGGGERHE